jgi:hypothetical protein
MKWFIFISLEIERILLLVEQVILIFKNLLVPYAKSYKLSTKIKNKIFILIFFLEQKVESIWGGGYKTFQSLCYFSRKLLRD